jgi:hypothetical protein
VTAREAALRRRSRSSVTADAPTHEQLIPFVEAAATVADHGDLKPWRLIVHRMHELGPDEELLGWLYVGGVEKTKPEKKHKFSASRYLTSL